MLSPSEEGFITKEKQKSLSDYQLCYWYALEIEKRQVLYSNIVKSMGGKVMDLSFDDLVKINPLIKRLNEIDLPNFSIREKIRIASFQATKKKVNNRREEKNRIVNFDIAEQEKKILKLFMKK